MTRPIGIDEIRSEMKDVDLIIGEVGHSVLALSYPSNSLSRLRLESPILPTQPSQSLDLRLPMAFRVRRTNRRSAVEFESSNGDLFEGQTVRDR
jgi:hypothetical protein